MTELSWQKSSFSGSGQNDCLEVAADSGGLPHLRESDDPSHVLTPPRSALRALITGVKAGRTEAR